MEGRSGIGTIGWAADMQMLVNQEARTILGAFQTTNQGCLSLESAMRAATTQLDNRRRRLGLRFRSLPEGDRAGELDCVVSAPGFPGRVERLSSHRR